MHRLNTFPVVHRGFVHAFLNLFALTPLIERFETEHGTLVSLALFAGRKRKSAERAYLMKAKVGIR